MSSGSGTDGTIISLPKGGGSLSGLGESFSPDLFTGTGNFSLPITIPSGRNGFQPVLNLGYSSGNGNGPFGLGWAINIPGVARKTTVGVPRYRDNSASPDDWDTFVLSRSEDLVPLGESTPGSTRYRPRVEGLFARIDRHLDARNDYWTVQAKDGLISTYGTPDSRGADAAAIADPTSTGQIRTAQWRLSETRDTFGNRVVYDYEHDSGRDGPRHFAQSYLSRIRYVDFADRDGNEQFLVSIVLHYEDRPDPFSNFRSGFEIRTRRRCTRVEVFTHADQARLTRSYDLTYLDSLQKREGSSTDLPRNAVSLLSRLQITGHDGDRSESLAPLDFSYTDFQPGAQRFFAVKGAALPAKSLAHPNVELVDLFGNGLPDIVEMNGSTRYWRNLGNGTFDNPREMATVPAGLSLADAGVQMIDAEGNGRADLLVTTPETSGYYPLTFGGSWDRRSYRPYRRAPSFSLDDPEVMLVDLDGDGVTDAIRSSTRMECYFNDPEEGWQESRFVPRRTADAFPNVSFSDPRVRWGDMTGDGLQDIVLIHDGNIEYWPNLGRGNWGARLSMREAPRFPYGYDPRRILLGDIDGDGAADLIYVDHCKVLVWINQSGNSWSEPIEIDGTPPLTDGDAVRLVDLLGSGTDGLLWSRDSTAPGERMYFLDFTGGKKPYLLEETSNNKGRVTRIGYRPSTAFYLQDEADRHTRWRTTLPFPVPVVATIETVDLISRGKLTSEYVYHHGYWDGVEREFRGFARVDQRDSELFDDYHSPGLHESDAAFLSVPAKAFSPPTESRTWFHLGPVSDGAGDWTEIDFADDYWPGDPPALRRGAETAQLLARLDRPSRRDALRALRGSVLRSELYARDGTEREDRPYTVTESLSELREEEDSGGGKRKRIFFPFAVAERTSQWERGDEPQTGFSFLDDYNRYGQPRLSMTIGVPRGRDYRVSGAAGEPYLAKTMRTDYVANDEGDPFIVDRVARVTDFEVPNDGTSSVFELWAAVRNGRAEKEVFGQTINYFDGEAFQGLPYGQIGDHGALVRTEDLVLTESILASAYHDLFPGGIPPYLSSSPGIPWNDDYPADFRAVLPRLAGYRFDPGDDGAQRGYFASSRQVRFDFQGSPDGRGLALARRDSTGHETFVEYDEFEFFPVAVTDPAGLKIGAVYDYGTLHVRLSTDHNGNRMAYGYSPAGLVESIAAMGKPGEAAGDRAESPGTRFAYDHLAFFDRGEPVSVRTISRVHHANDLEIALPERDEIIESVTFWDGFGRSLQTRSQDRDIVYPDADLGAQNAPLERPETPPEVAGDRRGPSGPVNVIVSAWKVYDNKGRVVEKYEPFFSTGWGYAPAREADLGQKASLLYDPRGRLSQTINPDQSRVRTVYGRLADLSEPDDFVPSPWEVHVYDANDNGGRTHGTGDGSHWNTPLSTVVDAFGRPMTTIERTGPGPIGDQVVTRSSYDIRGNLLAVADAANRVAFQHSYDLTDAVLRIESQDAGLHHRIFDAAGGLVEQRDGRGALALNSYDALNRPTKTWARDHADGAMTLRELVHYGDSQESGLTASEAQGANLLGRVHRYYDEAGVTTVELYDFKGEAIESSRQVIADAPIVSALTSPEGRFQVDWQPSGNRSLPDHATALLDPFVYRTTVSIDALGRPKSIALPEDVEGERRVLHPRYAPSGAMTGIELDGTQFVRETAYNAKGQRTLVAYGNGIMTRYGYDEKSFRLTRLRNEGFSSPRPDRFVGDGRALSDLIYEYDLMGNPTGIVDWTPGSGVPGNPDAASAAGSELAQAMAAGDALRRTFAYDPLYRLISATGRESDRPTPDSPWNDQQKYGDATKTRVYRERYDYDANGNLIDLRHQADRGSFRRRFDSAQASNRLDKLTQARRSIAYAYDDSGNLIGEAASRHFRYDYRNRLIGFQVRPQDAEPSIQACYLYDSEGQRIKKLILKQGGQLESRTYIGDDFEHFRRSQSGRNLENNTLHIHDGLNRVALIRLGPALPEDRHPAVQYQLGDHLGSSTLVVDDSGNWLNREEFTPFGETSFGGYVLKRYRYTGKERDEESGLNYHGARYYAPWLSRWLSPDPLGLESGINLYSYVHNNPLRFVDPNGLDGRDIIPMAMGDDAGGPVSRFGPTEGYVTAELQLLAQKRYEEQQAKTGTRQPDAAEQFVEGAADAAGDAAGLLGSLWVSAFTTYTVPAIGIYSESEKAADGDFSGIPILGEGQQVGEHAAKGVMAATDESDVGGQDADYLLASWEFAAVAVFVASAVATAGFVGPAATQALRARRLRRLPGETTVRSMGDDVTRIDADITTRSGNRIGEAGGDYYEKDRVLDLSNMTIFDEANRRQGYGFELMRRVIRATERHSGRNFSVTGNPVGDNAIRAGQSIHDTPFARQLSRLGFNTVRRDGRKDKEYYWIFDR